MHMVYNYYYITTCIFCYATTIIIDVISIERDLWRRAKIERGISINTN